jgi:hypothetical protein
MGYARRLAALPSPEGGGRIAMESVAGFAWNQWQLCRGMAGSFRVESVAGFAWNRWQLSRGIRTPASPCSHQIRKTPVRLYFSLLPPALDLRFDFFQAETT